MSLTEQTQDAVRKAMRSHRYCEHAPDLCRYLTMVEVEILRDCPVASSEEQEAINGLIADCVLESLILKGIVEPVGLDENGEWLVGLTEAGKDEIEG